MRDIALTVIVFGLLPYILMRPQVGIYTWSWLSYMNPHRLTWGFAYSMPFAQIVAICTFVSILFSKEKKTIQMSGLLGLYLFFIIWMCITTIFAISFYESFEQLVKVIKIQVIILLTIFVIKSKKDVDMLLWVIVLSIGFYGIKGGIFTIQTLGNHRVWGPAGSFIEENNSLAVALLMILPLFYYLWSQADTRWIRLLLILAMCLIIISVFGSQSRGAFIAIGATAIFLWLKLPNKAVWAIIFILMGLIMLAFMPEGWHTRMDTISNYQSDASAMGRIEAWKMSFNLANHRLLGGGFNPWTAHVYSLYADHWRAPQAAHSIYFSILGEHGWIGLFLFISVFITSWRVCTKLIKRVKNISEIEWIGGLCRMIQVSLIAYASGGAFLSLAYFDLPWHLVSIVIICRQIVNDHFQQSLANKGL